MVKLALAHSLTHSLSSAPSSDHAAPPPPPAEEPPPFTANEMRKFLKAANTYFLADPKFGRASFEPLGGAPPPLA